jgi:hypothetical protein
LGNYSIAIDGAALPDCRSQVAIILPSEFEPLLHVTLR